jgi:hypothetical protein
MGYSIATPIKSEKAKARMMAFLTKNFDNLGVSLRGPLGSDLSYDHGPCRIGFDNSITSDYAISMCAWIALKVGRVQVFPTKKCPRAAGPGKYIVYDGTDIWPLLLSSTYREKCEAYVQVNWAGCLVPNPLFEFRGQREKLVEISGELTRLDHLWTRQA